MLRSAYGRVAVEMGLAAVLLTGCQAVPMSGRPDATAPASATTTRSVPSRTASGAGPSAAANSSAQAWTPYANARYGYVLYYPATWSGDAETTNGDGLTLHAGPRTDLTVWGRNLVDSSADVHQGDIEAAVERGVTVTYETKTTTRSVVSGTKGDLVYYSSAWCGKGSCNYVEFWYPISDKPTMDSLVAGVVQRFTPGRVDQPN